jgi:hypothetical protein
MKYSTAMYIVIVADDALRRTVNRRVLGDERRIGEEEEQ